MTTYIKFLNLVLKSLKPLPIWLINLKQWATKLPVTSAVPALSAKSKAQSPDL